MRLQRTGMVVALVIALVCAASAQRAGQDDKQFQAALQKEMVAGDLKGAIEEYRKIVARPGVGRALAADALLQIAGCYEKLGDGRARAVYEQLTNDYADQPAATEARAKLAALRPSATGQSGQTTMQVWSGFGVDGSHVSADGRYLSFTDWATGDLAIRDLTTNVSRRLTNTGGWVASGEYAEASVLSADRRQIAYTWVGRRGCDLRVASIGSSGLITPRVLRSSPCTEYVSPTAWTPDGRNLVVLRQISADRTWQLGVVPLQDGSFTTLKSLEWRHPQRVSLSPDGRFIAYDVPAAETGSPSDILVLALDASRETIAVPGEADDFSPLWTPDGSGLVFFSDRGGSQSVWSIPMADGRPAGKPVMLRADVGQVGALGMTTSGALYYKSSGGLNTYVVPVEGIRATATPALASERFVNASSGPAWSPDGQQLAFYSGTTLVIRAIGTGRERQVQLPPAVTGPFGSGPKWFPDGRSVLIVRQQEARYAFYRFHLDTGAADRLHTVARASSWALSPDGRAIFWSVQSGQLMRFDIDSGRETTLKEGGHFITVAVSPDGRELAYVRGLRDAEFTAAIEVIPATGGDPREVFRGVSQANRYNSLGWTPDGRFLVFAHTGGLWRVSAGGGQAQVIEGFDLDPRVRIKGPVVHPDGQRIAFGTIGTGNRDISRLENFLPAPQPTR